MSDHVIPQIIAHAQTINSAKFPHFLIHVFEKHQEILLRFLVVHLHTDRFGILSGGECAKFRFADGMAEDVFDED
jgi:hypothetical protein